MVAFHELVSFSPQAAKNADATPKAPLTEEEKAEKLKRLEELRVKKRAEREAQEKADEQVRIRTVTGDCSKLNLIRSVGEREEEGRRRQGNGRPEAETC